MSGTEKNCMAKTNTYTSNVNNILNTYTITIEQLELAIGVITKETWTFTQPYMWYKNCPFFSNLSLRKDLEHRGSQKGQEEEY